MAEGVSAAQSSTMPMVIIFFHVAEALDPTVHPTSWRARYEHTADNTFSAGHRIAVNNLIREWDSNQPKERLLRMSILPVEGRTQGLLESILSMLTKRGIPFERNSN